MTLLEWRSRSRAGLALLLKVAVALTLVGGLQLLLADSTVASDETSDNQVYQLPDSLPAPPVALAESVPYRSQFIQGDPYAPSNCGPAVLAMIFSYFGVPVSVSEARWDVNEYMGVWNYDNGSNWLSLAWSARQHGLKPFGLLDEDWLFTKWTLFDLLAEANAGYPSILLVRYWDLPDHEQSSWWGDHYIVFLGLDEYGNVIYHDPAFHGTVGARRTMSQERLVKAWNNTATGFVRTAMSLRPGS